MGDLEKKRPGDSWQGPPGPDARRMMIVAIVCAAVALSGAGAGLAKSATPSLPSGDPAPHAAAEILSLELHQGDPGATLDLEASEPLVWTSYRNDEDALVIELPNATPSPAVLDLEPAAGIVESVAVELEENGDRPLTRLVVTSRRAVEHSVAAEGSRLQIALLPVGERGEELGLQAAASPVPATTSQAVPPSSAIESEALAEEWGVASDSLDLGTPDSPRIGPPPVGVTATQLRGIEVVTSGDATVIQIAGDGEFLYSSFRLEDPERFVIDLDAVINNAPRSTVPINDRLVERVRVAQYRSDPRPVARVVFDLRDLVPPTIERTSDGLTVTFGPASMVSPIAPSAGEEIGAAEPLVEEPESEPEPAPMEAAEMAAVSDGQTAPAIESWDAETAAPAAAEEQPAPTAPVGVEAEEIAAAPAQAAPPPAEPELPVETVTAAPAAAAAEQAPGLGAEAPTATSDVALFEAAEVELEQPVQQSQPTFETFTPQTIGGVQRQYQGEPMSLSLKDADIKDVLRSFAQISGLNIVVQPGVSGTVTVELTQVPWDQALEQVLKINDLGYELEGNIMRVAPVSKLRQEAEEEQRLRAAQQLSIPLSTVIKRISYAGAREIAGIIRTSVMSQRGSVIVDGRTNTLIIKELPQFMDTVIAVIEHLDTPEPQVMIEARIVETTKRFTRTLGIDWGFSGIADAAHGNTTGLQFPNNLAADGGVQLLTGAANGFLDISMGNVLNTFTLDATLVAAENEGLINILSAPKVATLNNERASIQSGLQIPIQTIANNTVSVQFVNATLRLDVTPHVTAEGTVLMDINIQKREPQLAFAVVGATNAPIATKEARTRVIVRDGGTTVIGGIYEVSTDQGQDRVPGLANIPILGHLFKNRRRTDENEELLIFITPRVIKL